MKDREIVISYLDSIKEELMMYKDSLSEKTFPYIDKLKKEYNCWEKDLAKIDGTWIKKEKKEKNDTQSEDTNVDDTLYEMIDEYIAYIGYKEDYEKTGSIEKLEMSHTELSHFLTLLTEMFTEISNHSRDSVDERAMIKSSIKSIYQTFG